MPSITALSLVSESALKGTGYALITLSTFATVVRFGIRGSKGRFWQWEDSFTLIAYLSYLAICITYIVLCPAMYRILHFEEDGYIPYPQLVSDGNFMTRVFFPNTLLFWTCLWFVKFSFMAQTKRLIARQRHYIVAWWSILVFTCLCYIGCVVSEFTSCRSLHDWFTFGQCSTPRDARAATISLCFAFAVDVVTDLMIIALPFRVLWNLQITPMKKIRVLSFFFVVALGVSAAITRTVAVIVASRGDQPSPSWLAFWAMIEGFIAILITALPAIGLLFTNVAVRKHASEKYSISPPTTNQKSTGSDGTFTTTKSFHRATIQSGSSEEYLNEDDKGIMMTVTIDTHSSMLSASRNGSCTSEKESNHSLPA